MEMKFVIDGDIVIAGDNIAYEGTVLGDLIEVRLHGVATLGHAGNGPKVMRLYVKRKVRGYDVDLEPANKYCGDDNLIASSPFACTLVMLNPSLPGSQAFVGKYSCEHARICDYRLYDDAGDPVQEFTMHMSGVNQSGRDGTPMLEESIAIHGFQTV